MVVVARTYDFLFIRRSLAATNGRTGVIVHECGMEVCLVSMRHIRTENRFASRQGISYLRAAHCSFVVTGAGLKAGE